MRTCRKCALAKPLSDFPKNGSCIGGHAHKCKACVAAAKAAWAKANRARLTAYNRAYLVAHPDVAEKHREYCRQYSRKLYAVNKDEILARSRERYAQRKAAKSGGSDVNEIV